MSSTAMKKVGRPTSYNDRLAERLLKMALDGATEAQMAKAASVSIATFRNWKAAHPDFLVALKEAKTIADDLVEASLYRRATGYSHPALKFFFHEGQVITEKYIEHYPPDTTACIFWLKNRQPERWRDVHKIDVNATVSHVLPSPIEAKQILEADYAMLPAPEVKVDDL
jgi:hypothetical protein